MVNNITLLDFQESNIELTGVSRVSIDELLDADNGRSSIIILHLQQLSKVFPVTDHFTVLCVLSCLAFE